MRRASVQDFVRVLDEICDMNRPLKISRLYKLSMPTREEMEAFARVWPDSIAVERRRSIIQNLLEIAEANFSVDFNAIFRYALNDPDAEVRATAVDGLWEDERADLIDRFLQMVREDPAPEVRASAAQALGKYVLQGELNKLPNERAEMIRVTLRDVFYDESEVVEVRRRALESLAFHDDEETRELIATAYEEPSHEMRVSAVFAMGRSIDPYWRETVLKELDNPSPEIRYEAARACGELAIRQAVPRLLDMLLDSDREIQEAAIWSLGQIGGKRAKRALQLLLQEEDEELTEAAEDALGELMLMEGEIGMPLYEFDVSELEEISLEDLEELDDLEDVKNLEELIERLEDEELTSG